MFGWPWFKPKTVIAKSITATKIREREKKTLEQFFGVPLKSAPPGPFTYAPNTVLPDSEETIAIDVSKSYRKPMTAAELMAIMNRDIINADTKRRYAKADPYVWVDPWEGR